MVWLDARTIKIQAILRQFRAQMIPVVTCSECHQHREVRALRNQENSTEPPEPTTVGGGVIDENGWKA